ncbi:MAG: polyprenyl synthetase family protein [Zoogloeaceae bacterium]|jgi:farnesyl diphosphate synthase|nr:polyprenyl synthetase family protein [Zoogloeaceae bacterium]
MARVQARMETALAERLPQAGIAARLHEAMRYAALGGGKRVRPLLVFAAGELVAAKEEALLACASAVELIHAYSLAHDDLPAMDNDVLRRGRPTCHVKFDEATALLVGDALQTRAFELLAAPGLLASARQLELLATLARASGSLGMAGGQAMDLASVGKTLSQPELELMHAMKTGALIRAAVLLGAGCGRRALAAARMSKLDHFAKCAGLLFQAIDDLLDCTASTAALGKTAGKDKAAGKPTCVSLMGPAAARDYAESLRQEALQSLAGFGAKAGRLIALTNFICARQF